MERPELQKIDLQKALAGILNEGRPGCLVTMSPGQWDDLLQAAYDSGWTLLEIDNHDQPVAAYRRPLQ